MTGATLLLQAVSFGRCFDVEQLSEVTGLALLLHFFCACKWLTCTDHLCYSRSRIALIIFYYLRHFYLLRKNT
ncbi:MAG: hypothetical protein D3922_17335 [Candidatus Electrothrix sp. AR1]|nr:hypothetical protein [Candidatus Electrothrix sp. AR1]